MLSEKAIFSTNKTIDPETAILIAICYKIGILHHIFDKQDLREKKKWVKEITSGNLTGDPTKNAVEALQADILVTVIIPAVVTISS